jgi:hypothetical protein
MDDEEETISVIIDFEQKVNCVRYLGGGILPSKIHLQTEVIPTEDTVDEDFDIAFTKIKFWFDTIVNRSIVFCRSNEDAFDMLIKDGKPRMANHLIITPSEPTDEHLAVLFQSKMQALSSDKFNFGQVKIKSNSSNGLMFTYVGSWEEDLPEMKDWFSTTPYYFETPWWTRDDISTIDMIIGDYDPKTTPLWASKLDFIEDTLRSDGDRPEIENLPVIIKRSFKPKVINGEKPPEDKTDS